MILNNLVQIFRGIPTVQKMKFSIKDFFSKCDQIRSFLNGKLHFLRSDLIFYFYLFIYFYFFLKMATKAVHTYTNKQLYY